MALELDFQLVDSITQVNSQIAFIFLVVPAHADSTRAPHHESPFPT